MAVRVRHRRRNRLDVRGVATGRAHEGVFADGRGEEELLGARAAHCARRRGDDDDVEPEAGEHPNGEQGVPTDSEEVVVTPDVLDPEHL